MNITGEVPWDAQVKEDLYVLYSGAIMEWEWD